MLPRRPNFLMGPAALGGRGSRRWPPVFATVEASTSNVAASNEAVGGKFPDLPKPNHHPKEVVGIIHQRTWKNTWNEISAGQFLGFQGVSSLCP
jgi:hypothetical protein